MGSRFTVGSLLCRLPRGVRGKAEHSRAITGQRGMVNESSDGGWLALVLQERMQYPGMELFHAKGRKCALHRLSRELMSERHCLGFRAQDPGPYTLLNGT